MEETGKQNFEQKTNEILETVNNATLGEDPNAKYGGAIPLGPTSRAEGGINHQVMMMNKERLEEIAQQENTTVYEYQYDESEAYISMSVVKPLLEKARSVFETILHERPELKLFSLNPSTCVEEIELQGDEEKRNDGESTGCEIAPLAEMAAAVFNKIREPRPWLVLTDAIAHDQILLQRKIFRQIQTDICERIKEAISDEAQIELCDKILTFIEKEIQYENELNEANGKPPLKFTAEEYKSVYDEINEVVFRELREEIDDQIRFEVLRRCPEVEKICKSHAKNFTQLTSIDTTVELVNLVKYMMYVMECKEQGKVDEASADVIANTAIQQEFVDKPLARQQNNVQLSRTRKKNKMPTKPKKTNKTQRNLKYMTGKEKRELMRQQKNTTVQSTPGKDEEKK